MICCIFFSAINFDYFSCLNYDGQIKNKIELQTEKCKLIFILKIVLKQISIAHLSDNKCLRLFLMGNIVYLKNYIFVKFYPKIIRLN